MQFMLRQKSRGTETAGMVTPDRTLIVRMGIDFHRHRAMHLLHKCGESRNHSSPDSPSPKIRFPDEKIHPVMPAFHRITLEIT